jgi:hypothetical protein
MTTRENERVIAAQLVQAIQDMRQSTTEAYGQLLGRITNNVLMVATYVMPAAGVIPLTFPAPAGCITVDYQGAAGTTATVTSGGAEAAAPVSGTGVYIIPAGEVRTVPIASHQATLYAPHDSTVCVIAYTNAATPTIG